MDCLKSDRGIIFLLTKGYYLGRDTLIMTVKTFFVEFLVIIMLLPKILNKKRIGNFWISPILSYGFPICWFLFWWWVGYPTEHQMYTLFPWVLWIMGMLLSCLPQQAALTLLWGVILLKTIMVYSFNNSL